MKEVSEDVLDGIPLHAYRRRWAVLVATCVALLSVMLANSSINLALPMMSVDLNISLLVMTWVINVYTLLFSSLLFIAGAFGDRYGRKLALQAGSIIFAASALYAGIYAKSGTELIVARAIMGFGGALVMPTTLSIINNVFPRNERARAIAIWTGIGGAGMMFGNIVSGLLLEHFSWRSLFYLSVGIAGFGVIINQIVIDESRDADSHAVDWLGGALSSAGIFGVVYGITEAPSKGIADGYVLLGLVGGIAALLAFVWWEGKAKSPLLDMQLFKNRAFSVSSLTITLTFLAMMGVFFSVSQLQQLILGMSPLKSSLGMIPMMIPMLILAPVIPTIVKKIGARVTMAAGLFVISVAFFIMSRWTVSLTYWHFIGAMMVMMAGIAGAMAPGTNILMASVPRGRSGMGSAMNDTTRELGGALGIAVLGATLSSAYTRNVAEVAKTLPPQLKEALEGSLATALHVSQFLGPKAKEFADYAKAAWMDALATAALVSAAIIFVAAIIAFVALPKHTDQQSDTI